jgi:hypothetical protein
VARKIIPIIPRITQGSHSRLGVFEQCKHRANLKYVQRIPEPDRALRPGQTEHANDRGSRIHDNCELYVRNQAKLCAEAAKYFRPELDNLHERYKRDRATVILEEDWAFTSNWESCDWGAKEAWLRMKLDALVFLSKIEAVAIDYKTGRKDGNEIKHNEQTQLYQLGTFMKYPELEIVHTELWYLDQDELTSMTYRRDQGLRFQRRWNERMNNMTSYEFTDEKTDANPSIFTCKWCLYGPKGSGICKRGV